MGEFVQARCKRLHTVSSKFKKENNTNNQDLDVVASLDSRTPQTAILGKGGSE
jgi:hypothetical protein